MDRVTRFAQNNSKLLIAAALFIGFLIAVIVFGYKLHESYKTDLDGSSGMKAGLAISIIGALGAAAAGAYFGYQSHGQGNLSLRGTGIQLF